MKKKSVVWVLAAAVAAVVCADLVVRTQSSAAPILVVVSSAAPNPYGPYLAEILRAEGINAFSIADVSTVTATQLANVSLVVLAEMPLTSAQATTFSNYVAAGGRLVAMNPDAKIAPVLGVTPLGSSTTEGYLGINTANSSGQGFPATTLPFHGQAQNYALGTGASTVATLYSNATTPTAYPAVVKSGGTVTWAYDLDRTVVYTRQGNPANAGIEHNTAGIAALRTTDVFYQAIDLDRVSIPHADIQMRLLARVIADLLSTALPLPKLWYFPGAVRTLLVLTGDSHANPQSYFDNEIASIESRGVRASIYMYNGSTPSTTSVATWRAKGHEVGMHPSAFQYGRTLDAAYQANQSYFSLNGYGTPSATTRNHLVEWQGWVDAAKVAAKYGILLDTSFYTWGPAVTYPNGTQAHGFINGSGLPMHFVDQAGAIVPVYQQVTSLVDEQLLVGPQSENDTTAQALAVSQQLINNSQGGGYSVIATQFHVDYYAFGPVQPWAEGTMDYANSLAVPMWTAQRWLNYTTARAASTMTAMAWSAAAKQLSFTLGVPAGSEAQSLMLPGVFGGLGLTSVTVNGTAAAITSQTITGRTTSFVAVGPGSSSVIVSYTTPVAPPPPVAVNDTAAVTQGNSVTIPVLANDSDPDGFPLTVISTSSAGGVVVINANQTVTYTPNQTTCGVDTFTYTISDGHNTASASVSVTVTCLDVTQATVAAFGASCAVPANTIVSQIGAGEVRLAGTFGDEYAASTLNPALWVSGTWSGGAYTPVPAGSVLSIANANGAYVHSLTSLPITTLESSASFSGQPWEHVGWGSLNFSGGYLLFSTYNSSTNLFARSNNGSGEQQTNLGPIPTGFHTYRIDRTVQSGTTDLISYYIDGALVAQHTLGTVAPMYVYQSNNGGVSQTLKIDRIWVYPAYVSSGTFQSCPLDGGTGSFFWTTATWSATTPAGTTLKIATRTSVDGITWSAWSAPLTASGQNITSPAGRYLEYLLELASTDPNQSPVVSSITLNQIL